MKNKRAAKAKAKRRQARQEELDNLTPTQIIERTVDYDTIMFCYVLHEKFGWGKQRLERLLHERDELGDAVDQRYVTFGDLLGVLKKEVKMDI